MKNRFKHLRESEGWFDQHGNLTRDIPQECVEDCTQPGVDAYDSCSYWVDELGFDKGLDIPMAKGYLKEFGAWEDEELVKMSPKEVAIKVLWLMCGDIKDGEEYPMMDGSYYKKDFENSSAFESKHSKCLKESDGWFSKYGELEKDIPQECVEDCTMWGTDAYDSCSYWVDELGFDKDLDIPLAKGYLKSTGAWDTDEISEMSPKEVAIKVLWLMCGDIKDGNDYPSIDSGNYYKKEFENDDSVLESRKCKVHSKRPFKKLKKTLREYRLDGIRWIADEEDWEVVNI